MHRWSSALAVMAGAALITTVAGTALAQEESPAPEVSPAAEASPAAEVVEPSTLSILQVATDKTAGTKLKGRKYAKAIAKAAPNAVGYLISTAGVDNIDRIIELSRTARAVDEAGDAKAAKALIDIAKLLYRNEWTQTKSDHVALDTAIAEAIAAGDYPEEDPALVLWRGPVEFSTGFVDVCIWPGGTEYQGASTEAPLCADDRGRWARVDDSLIDWSKNFSTDFYSGDPETADIGGLGIHKVVQDGTANEKLAGKQYKRALAKTLKKSGPAVAGYYAGGSGAGAMEGIIDLVLLAREADEAGNAKAAKAFMALAVAAYREGLTTSEQTPEEFNTALSELGYAIFDGESGGAFELFPPGGLEDICLWSKKSGDGFFVDLQDMSSCARNGGKVLRVSQDDVDNSKNGEKGFYLGSS